MTSNELTPYTPHEGPLDLVAVRMDPKAYPRLKNLPAEHAIAALARIITAALSYTGRQLDLEAVKVMAVALRTELLQDPDGIGTANITLEELQWCIRRAVLGYGPELYGINVASLYKVASAYCTGEGHQAQEDADKRHALERKQALAASPAGPVLDKYAQNMITNTTTR